MIQAVLRASNVLALDQPEFERIPEWLQLCISSLGEIFSSKTGAVFAMEFFNHCNTSFISFLTVLTLRYEKLGPIKVLGLWRGGKKGLYNVVETFALFR